MKLYKTFILGIIMTVSVTGYAGTEESQVIETYTATSGPGGADVLIDIPFRIVGLAGTIVGSAVFVATSPFCGLATALRPHNAILKCADIFVVEPAKWTFVRPVGMGPVMPGHSGNTYGHYEARRDWEK